MTINEQIKDFKRRLIIGALRNTNGNIRAAARELGTFSVNLDRWIRELGLLDYAYRLRRGAVIIDPIKTEANDGA